MAAPGAGGLRYRLTVRLLHRQGPSSRHTMVQVVELQGIDRELLAASKLSG
jgi:arginase family enzyme